MSDVMLDKYFPPRGPCAFCGHKDARHRLFDAILGMRKAGDSVETIAHAYGLTMKQVFIILEVQPYQEVKVYG